MHAVASRRALATQHGQRTASVVALLRERADPKGPNCALCTPNFSASTHACVHMPMHMRVRICTCPSAHAHAHAWKLPAAHAAATGLEVTMTSERQHRFHPPRTAPGIARKDRMGCVTGQRCMDSVHKGCLTGQCDGVA
eukprot:325593-Chlamydomonas_euryale.AAC.3